MDTIVSPWNLSKAQFPFELFLMILYGSLHVQREASYPATVSQQRLWILMRPLMSYTV